MKTPPSGSPTFHARPPAPARFHVCRNSIGLTARPPHPERFASRRPCGRPARRFTHDPPAPGRFTGNVRREDHRPYCRSVSPAEPPPAHPQGFAWRHPPVGQPDVSRGTSALAGHRLAFPRTVHRERQPGSRPHRPSVSAPEALRPATLNVSCRGAQLSQHGQFTRNVAPEARAYQPRRTLNLSPGHAPGRTTPG